MTQRCDAWNELQGAPSKVKPEQSGIQKTQQCDAWNEFRVRHPRSSLSSQGSKRLSSVMRGMSSRLRHPRSSLSSQGSKRLSSVMRGMSSRLRHPRSSLSSQGSKRLSSVMRGMSSRVRHPRSSLSSQESKRLSSVMRGMSSRLRHARSSLSSQESKSNSKPYSMHLNDTKQTCFSSTATLEEPMHMHMYTFMGPNFRISSSRPRRLFFRWNGRKIGAKRVKRRPRQSYLLSLAHTPNTNEQKQGNTKKRKSRKSLQERRKWCNQKNNLPISSSPPSPQKLLQAPIPSNSFLTSSFTSSSLEHGNQHANMWTNNTQTYNDKALHHVLRLRHPWIWNRWYREAMREEHWARPVRWW